MSILYENSGRINYKRLNGATMGLREPVGIDGEMEQTWNIYSLPMDEDYLNSLRYDAGDARTVEGTESELNRSFLADQCWYSYQSAGLLQDGACH